MNRVEDLDVFKLAHELALKIYSTTEGFPKGELFSLIEQTRRAATSVGMNLMEGAMRLGSREYRQFVGIARGSAGKCVINSFSRGIGSTFLMKHTWNFAPVTIGSFKCFCVVAIAQSKKPKIRSRDS